MMKHTIHASLRAVALMIGALPNFAAAQTPPMGGQGSESGLICVNRAEP
jgi:hypothetical protein